MNRERGLRECGYPGKADLFRDEVLAMSQRMYPAWTDETLLHNPADALRFCEVVRQHFQITCSDELILRTLTNTRKRTRVAG